MSPEAVGKEAIVGHTFVSIDMCLLIGGVKRSEVRPHHGDLDTFPRVTVVEMSCLHHGRLLGIAMKMHSGKVIVGRCLHSLVHKV